MRAAALIWRVPLLFAFSTFQASGQSERQIVAETCLEVVSYARELGFAIHFMEIGYPTGALDVLSQADSNYRQSLDLFRIIAGPNARVIAFDENVGFDHLYSIASNCIQNAECPENSTSIVSSFTGYLMGFCRRDYDDSQ